MHKFYKILVEIILFCSPYAYLIVVKRDHFHFVYFRYQCVMLPKFYQIYDVRLLHVRVSEL